MLELGITQTQHDTCLSQIAAIDQAISQKVYQSGSKAVPRAVLMLLEHSGNGLIWIPLVLVAIFIPVGRAARAFCANLEIGFIVDLLIVGLLKATIKRQRPVYNNPNDYHVVNKIDHYSFPSGHASRCTFIALLFCVYGASADLRGLVVSACVLMWGLGTSTSRALMGRHFVFDVVAGCLVGVVTLAVISMGTFKEESMLINERFIEQLDKQIGYEYGMRSG